MLVAAWHSLLFCVSLYRGRSRFIDFSLVSSLACLPVHRDIAHVNLLDASQRCTDHSMHPHSQIVKPSIHLLASFTWWLPSTLAPGKLHGQMER